MESVFLPAGQTGVWSVVVRATDIAGQGVPNVGSDLGQDFALVVYNAASTNRSDVPNLSTNNSCGTAVVITENPFIFTNTLSTTGSNSYQRVQPESFGSRWRLRGILQAREPDARCSVHRQHGRQRI